jgi:hypothetical protein
MSIRIAVLPVNCQNNQSINTLKGWDKASTDERKPLRPILQSKVQNLDNYTPARRQEL